MKKLKITCPTCDNSVTCDWNKILNHNAIRPGYDFGIDRIRFFIMPNIFCNECYSRCQLELIEETETKTTHIKSLKQWP